VKPFDLRGNIKDVINLMKEQASFKNIDLREIISDEMPSFIIADPKRMKQVLINLIGNALKFTFKGHIHLKLSFAAYYQEVEYTKFDKTKSKILQKDKDKIRILFEVEDTGVGIKADKL